MRLFADSDAMPRWWPQAAQHSWLPVARSIDLVRGLHTRPIEWIALYATLWLRAAIVVTAPALGAVMPAGVAPYAPGTSGEGDAIWVAIASWSAVSALLAPWIVPRAQRHVRQPLCTTLFLIEQPLALAAHAGRLGRPRCPQLRTPSLVRAVGYWDFVWDFARLRGA